MAGFAATVLNLGFEKIVFFFIFAQVSTIMAIVRVTEQIIFVLTRTGFKVRIA